MTLSTRQWIIVFGLIVFFGVATAIARSGGDKVPAIDTVAWCTNADGLTGLGDLMNGEAADANIDDYEQLKDALFAIEVLAPYEIRGDIGQIANFTLVAKLTLADTPWPAAFSVARGQVNTDDLDAAIEDLDRELQACGIQF
ncbi:MAG: hypothetical protein ACI9C1_001325 [Candidatus Aldehydirespiratoraceae bacterium]|jgi:hypothetical protein